MVNIKRRLYQRQVVEARPKHKQFVKDFAAEVRRDTFFAILLMIAVLLIAILCGNYISPYCAFFAVPIMVALSRSLTMRIGMKRAALRIMSANYDKYDIWMELQLKKEYADKDIDIENAKKLYRRFINQMPIHVSELKQSLREALALKKGNQITVSVLCGFIFMADAPDAREVLYDAKYNHGQAGNMVLTAWILYYDGNSAEASREALECEFKTFWEKLLTGRY